jgi:threonine dehydratase
MGMSPPVTRRDIRAAAERIDGRVRRTPVLSLGRGAFGVDARITLKLEQLQVTGSFKPRGAFSKMLASDVPPAGVIAASGGNFGLAVAVAAGVLGHCAEIFVPSTSPATKIDRIREHGAEINVIEGLYDDAADACRLRAQETGACWMHPYDQPEVVAGQGTIGLELSDQIPRADSVLVGVGGGGLIGGIAAWYEGSLRVVGVEPAGSRCLDAALAAGEPIDVPVESVAADSLGAKRVGTIAFALARRYVHHVTLVPDQAIVEAQRTLWRDLRVVAEPGGAASFAALITGAYRPEPGEHVVVLICGANCDPSTVAT